VTIRGCGRSAGRGQGIGAASSGRCLPPKQACRLRALMGGATERRVDVHEANASPV